MAASISASTSGAMAAAISASGLLAWKVGGVVADLSATRRRSKLCTPVMQNGAQPMAALTGHGRVSHCLSLSMSWTSFLSRSGSTARSSERSR